MHCFCMYCTYNNGIKITSKYKPLQLNIGSKFDVRRTEVELELSDDDNMSNSDNEIEVL